MTLIMRAGFAREGERDATPIQIESSQNTQKQQIEHQPLLVLIFVSSSSGAPGMADLLSSSLPIPSGRRISSPVKGGQHAGSIPLQEQTAAARNIKTNMPAPIMKPKAEPRKTLVERAGATAKAITTTTSLVRSKSTSNLTHIRSNSVSTIVPRSAAVIRKTSASQVRPGTAVRPTSVTGTRTGPNGARPVSAASSRPGSATDSRPEETIAPPKKARRAAWDTKGRLEDMEEAYSYLKGQLKEVTTSAVVEKDSISTALEDERIRVSDLTLQKQLLQQQFDVANEQIGKLTGELHIARMEREQLIHRHKMDLEDEKASAARSELQVRSLLSDKDRELDNAKREADNVKRHLESQIDDKSREIRSLQSSISDIEGELAREKKCSSSLRDQLAEQSTGALTLQQYIKSLKTKIEVMEHEAITLKSIIEERNAALAASNAEKEDLQTALISEETQRRILHNQIQELKGNIRVFCRVRPPLSHEPADASSIRLTDTPEEIEVIGTGAEMSLSGKEDKTYDFHFDKVSVSLWGKMITIRDMTGGS